MLPETLRHELETRIAQAEDPREMAVDVMLDIQKHHGYMSDAAMEEASTLLGMTTVELEGLATFYDHIYRQPVGKHVIRVCDGAVCWMEGHLSVIDHIMKRLDVTLGGTTADGFFTLLPVCCIGYCDRGPAMMVDNKIYGRLTPEKIDRVLGRLTNGEPHTETES
jgi:NADH-quinone oxidoreductase subunit E